MMPDKEKHLITTAALALGLGLAYVLTKYNKSILKTIRSSLQYNNPLRNQQIEIVNTAEECKQVIQKLKRHCSEYNILGFDCEWVNVVGARRPVALLQLASHRGLCALIRLCHMQGIPKELKELLEDDQILKVGVAPIDDARYLSNDFSIKVASTFDLRYLAEYLNHKPQGLSKLSESLLGITLDKNWRIRCSDWEAVVLSPAQTQYAANDALVAIEIYKKLVGKLNSNGFFRNTQDFAKMIDFCKNNADRKYKTRNTGTAVGKSKPMVERKSYGKSYHRGFATIKRDHYDNCFLYTPNDQPLCTCERKKAEWYINKELGVKISDDPLIVRLNFEPASHDGEINQFYTQIKENQCVVCGAKDSYIRKNVVPREYRKLFPVVMKEHTSHDVLLLCTNCHQRSNVSDILMRKRLENLCNAPLSTTPRFEVLQKQTTLKSAAKALLQTENNIPESRKAELRIIVLEHFPDEPCITEEMLIEASSVLTTKVNENYESHSRLVVEYFSMHPETKGLTQLEKLWREHFLTSMKPKYMPKLWSVSHNANSNKKRINFCNNDLENKICNGVGSSTSEDQVENADLTFDEVN